MDNLYIENVLSCFHHIHHHDGNHHIHHCGGKHKEIDPTVDYEIEHCSCGKHNINKKQAIGHTSDKECGLVEISFEFIEECPDGGWHIENGKIVK